MIVVSRSRSSLLVAIEQIRNEDNIVQSIRTELVDELARKENELSIIVYGMSFLLPLLGAGVGYTIRGPKNNE